MAARSWPRAVVGLLVGFALLTVIVLALAVAVINAAVGVRSDGLPVPTDVETLTSSRSILVFDRIGTAVAARAR